MIIRRATAEDAPAIEQILAAAFAEVAPLYTPEGIAATTINAETIRTRLREGPTWIATERRRPAGWPGGVPPPIGTVSAVARNDALYIRSMAVLPSARGQGVGESLLRAVESFAIEEGFHELTLSTTPYLHAAIRLYERFGFARTEEQDLFGTPLFGMRKTLRHVR